MKKSKTDKYKKSEELSETSSDLTDEERGMIVLLDYIESGDAILTLEQYLYLTTENRTWSGGTIADETIFED